MTEEQIRAILRENEELRKENRELKAENEFLRSSVADLARKLKELEEMMKTNSSNSSKPPSRDSLKERLSRISHRKKSEKKVGGQEGHEGHHLKMVEKPDHVIENVSDVCDECGKDLKAVAGQVIRRGQLFDLPLIKLEVTEHRQVNKCCPNCGKWNKGKMPALLSTANTAYGENLQNSIIYWNIRQFIPVDRIKELLQVMTGHVVSTGWIMNVLKRINHKMGPTYEELKKRLENSEVGGMDETGCAVESKLKWLLVLQNTRFVYLFISSFRGLKAIRQEFPNHLKKLILVTDCYRSYFKVECKTHQICLAHIRRDCEKLIQFRKSQWARDLKAIIDLIFKITALPRISQDQKEQVEKQLDQILGRPLTRAHREVVNLRNRLIKHRKYITTCFYNRKVPPDNNGSERAIRNNKVKTKICGGFRTQDGAEQYCISRSIIDSAIRQDICPMVAIANPQLLLKA